MLAEKVKVIERQVKNLDRTGLAAFRDWFRKFDSDAWERKSNGMPVPASLKNYQNKLSSSPNLEKPARFEAIHLFPFWHCYETLPKPVQTLADKNLKLLKADYRHPSLRFKKIGKYRSVRIGLNYRALAVESSEGFVWF